MRTFSLIIGLSILIFISIGCAAQQQSIYYWGDYSGSLYKVHKDPNETNIGEHQALLENIIKESESRNLRVPPGVYAELGYIYSLKKYTNEAIGFFNKEKQIYPESTIFMDNLIRRTGKLKK
jgi:hypothetical protein